jgi:hypothetical protein
MNIREAVPSAEYTPAKAGLYSADANPAKAESVFQLSFLLNSYLSAISGHLP